MVYNSTFCPTVCALRHQRGAFYVPVELYNTTFLVPFELINQSLFRVVRISPKLAKTMDFKALEPKNIAVDIF
jgi:hypothetical protein